MSLDADRAQQVKSVDLAPGYTYAARSVQVLGDAPFCFSVIEESGPQPSRALYLGCHAGGGEPATALITGSRVTGRRGAAYSVVVFRRQSDDPPGGYVVTIEVNKEKTK